MSLLRFVIGMVLILILVSQIWTACTSEHCRELSSTYTTYYDPDC